MKPFVLSIVTVSTIILERQTWDNLCIKAKLLCTAIRLYVHCPELSTTCTSEPVLLEPVLTSRNSIVSHVRYTFEGRSKQVSSRVPICQVVLDEVEEKEYRRRTEEFAVQVLSFLENKEKSIMFKNEQLNW
jgi:hypothetical protein